MKSAHAGKIIAVVLAAASAVCSFADENTPENGRAAAVEPLFGRLFFDFNLKFFNSFPPLNVQPRLSLENANVNSLFFAGYGTLGSIESKKAAFEGAEFLSFMTLWWSDGYRSYITGNDYGYLRDKWYQTIEEEEFARRMLLNNRR